MQSPMIQSNPALGSVLSPVRRKESGYTELQVLQSAAGYYVGTLWQEYDAEGNLVWQEPGSRDSGYFAEEAAAAAFLAEVEASGNTFALRPHP